MSKASITDAATRSNLRQEENLFVLKFGENFTFVTLTSATLLFHHPVAVCQTEVIQAIIVRLSPKKFDVSARAVSDSV